MLTLGPLSSGYHILQLTARAVAVDGAATVVSDPVGFQWEIVQYQDSTLRLADLPDGDHSLQVVADGAKGVRVVTVLCMCRNGGCGCVCGVVDGGSCGWVNSLCLSGVSCGGRSQMECTSDLCRSSLRMPRVG